MGVFLWWPSVLLFCIGRMISNKSGQDINHVVSDNSHKRNQSLNGQYSHDNRHRQLVRQNRLNDLKQTQRLYKVQHRSQLPRLLVSGLLR